MLRKGSYAPSGKNAVEIMNCIDFVLMEDV